ncbi:hypothetical protein DPMN_132401 [Dreissena polymorpha]|uniref:Uncharacterized protein n=1 Tax=Dreissena polymorpha TaxID=45954 RepID=A0A9D4FV13_DREPO|nr:hypothetical protein DPMN_132401 [Dreissena polymorpha]
MISTADYFLNWIDDASTTRTPTTTIPESVNIKTSIGRFEGASTLVADGSDLNKKSKNVDIWSGKNGKAALLDSNLSLTQKVAENSTHVDSIVNAKGNYFGKKQVMLETLETRNETPEKTHGSSSFVTTAKTVVDSKDLQEVASSAQQKTIGQSPQKSFVNEDTHFEIANEFHGQTDTSSNEAVVSVKSLNSHKIDLKRHGPTEFKYHSAESCARNHGPTEFKYHSAESCARNHSCTSSKETL